MKRLCFLAFLGLTQLLVVSHAQAVGSDPVNLVDPLVGTATYGGALYPGAALPFSEVKLSPDTTNPSTAGYNPDQPIIGFSHTHIGGTGGAAFGGQILVRPQGGPLDVSLKPSPKSDETAAPGYYSVRLVQNDVRAELTCTERAGVHRYTFAGAGPERLLVDISAAINNGSAAKPSGVCTGSTAHFVSEREIEGQASFVAGYARLTYTVYFVVVLDRTPQSRGTWLDAEARPGTTDVTGGNGQRAGFYVEYAGLANTPIGLRVGISYSDIAHARQHLQASDGLSFDQVKARAQTIWRQNLNSIAIEGGTLPQRRQFYTALYRMVLAPTDVTSDNPWAGESDSYWDIYTIWDTFRTANPLLTLTHPEREQAIIRSMLAVYQKTGWLPDGWTYNKTGIPLQGGTNFDIVIADAFAKKLGGFNRELAYEAIKKNATVPTASKIYPNFGRMEPYFTLGYVPSTVAFGKDAQGQENEYSAGVSRTLEYAYNDFAVANVAEALGHKDEAEKFRQRSLSAYNLFNPETKFFWGKNAAGEWIPNFDPTILKWGWTTAFYEGTAWQYRFSAPHDIQGLINRLGGKEAFLKELDTYFDGHFHYQGNEPGFLTPWLHVYAGRPDKNVDRIHEILAKNYNLTPGGYGGDEDVGAVSAWYLFAAMGFYPNAGQDVYLLSSPIFDRATLKLGESGKSFVITAHNQSPTNKYVQYATLNGKPWNQAWFRHGDISGGAELVLQMGPKPSSWGTKILPPSLTPVG